MHKSWLLCFSLAALLACNSENGGSASESGTDSSSGSGDGSGDTGTDTTVSSEPPTGTGTGTGTDAATGSDTTDTPTGSETDPGFTPMAGAYALSPGARGGTCDPDNNISGSTTFSEATVAASDGGFTLSLEDGLSDPVVLTCTLTGQDFTCTGPAVEKFSQNPPPASAAMTFSAAGAWTSASELSFTVTGALACTGDAAACDEAGVDWGLQMPCDMTQLHTGAVDGG